MFFSNMDPPTKMWTTVVVSQQNGKRYIIRTCKNHSEAHGVVSATVRDPKATVDALKKRDPINENEIKEIVDFQKIVDEAIGAYRDQKD